MPGVINGRIERPGQAVRWGFQAKKGHPIEFEIRPLESPLIPRISIETAAGKELLQPSGTRWLFNPPGDGSYVLRVRDRFASRGGLQFLYRIRAVPAQAGFRLTMPASATLLRGGSAKVRLQVERLGGYNGPISLTFAGLPRGVSVAPLNIGPGQQQVDLTLSADANAPVGPAKLLITGTALIADKQHTISATTASLSGEPPLQDLLLGVGIKAPFKFLADYDLRLAPRGSTFRKTFRIEREAGFTGSLQARLADHQNRHLQGVIGPVVTIPADATSFEYPVSLPPWMEIGRTSRSVIVLTGKVTVDGKEHTVSYSAQGQNDQIIAVVETGRLGLQLERATVSTAAPAEVVFRIRRGKDISGPVTVSLIIPGHIRGVESAAVTVPADQSSGTLRIRWAPQAGPFNHTLLIRAVMKGTDGEMVAEAPLEVVKE